MPGAIRKMDIARLVFVLLLCKVLDALEQRGNFVR